MINTEGIKYTGSKKTILEKIINLIPDDVENVLDGFAGTTRVSQALKLSGYNVDSNDVAIYSKIFNYCYLINNKPKSYYEKNIIYLNELVGFDGWFTKNYGGVVSSNKDGSAIQSDGKKRPFQKHNTMKLDAIRIEIDNISKNNIEKSVYLTSLILALDKVDNTLGHQVAYLKEWSKRSYNTMKLKVPELIINDKKYNATRNDIFNNKKSYDLIYLDPPYGTNNQKMPTSRIRYASYYHLWTTIVLNDEPDVFGAASRREDASSDKKDKAISVFENTDYNIVKTSIENLMKLDSKYFIFSYNNKSKVSIIDLETIFKKFNLKKVVKFSHKENVMKHMKKDSIWVDDSSQNFEYLFLIEKEL